MKSSATKESITAIAKSNAATKKVSQKMGVYTEHNHLETADYTVKELYTDLKSGIFRFGKDIEVRPKKKYITFRRKRGFVGFVFLKIRIKAYLNIQLSDLRDPEKKARDVKEIGHYSHGDTEVTVTDPNEIPYVLTLIKQSYERN